VEINVKQNTLVIEPLRHPREDWEEAFRNMSENRDDALLDGDSPAESAFDNSEWEW
jgi:virulence-associated protein VagC